MTMTQNISKPLRPLNYNKDQHILKKVFKSQFTKHVTFTGDKADHIHPTGSSISDDRTNLTDDLKLRKQSIILSPLKKPSMQTNAIPKKPDLKIIKSSQSVPDIRDRVSEVPHANSNVDIGRKSSDIVFVPRLPTPTSVPVNVRRTRFAKYIDSVPPLGSPRTFSISSELRRAPHSRSLPSLDLPPFHPHNYGRFKIHRIVCIIPSYQISI